MTTKTFADLEKEIEKGCKSIFYDENSYGEEIEYKCGSTIEDDNVYLCDICQAKLDLLKEVKKIIANDFDSLEVAIYLQSERKFCQNYGMVDIGTFKKIINTNIERLKSKLGLTSEEKE